VPVLIRINKQKAILRSGVWRCADPQTEQLLNSATEAWILQTGGPPVSDSNPERTLAAQVVPSLGGRILLQVRGKQLEARRAFFARRQMKLFPD
jgi:hypothetical protein